MSRKQGPSAITHGGGGAGPPPAGTIGAKTGIETLESGRVFKRLLVTGGAGFIGSHFVRLLTRTRKGTEVVVLDRLTYAGNRANLADVDGHSFVQGDICDLELVDRLASEADGIVNFAAETHVDRSLLDPLAFIKTDVLGTAVLCEAARRYNHQAFLQVSTDEVYGDCPSGRSDEDDPLRPRSPYSASKAGAEHLAWSYAASFGLPLLVTRGSNTYGPYQFPEKMVPILVANAIDGLPLPLYGDGRAVRDYLYVEDHCRAIDAVLHRGAIGSVYNVGTGRETAGVELAQAVLRIHGKSADLIEYVEDRPGHDRRYALNLDRIEGAVGWKAEVGLEEGLRLTAGWYQERQDWWRPLRSPEYWEYYRRNYRPQAASGSSPLT